MSYDCFSAAAFAPAAARSIVPNKRTSSFLEHCLELCLEPCLERCCLEHFVGRHPNLVGGVRVDEPLNLVVDVLEAVAGHDGGEVLHEVGLEAAAAVVDLLALLVRQPVLVDAPDERHRDRPEGGK